MTDIQGQESCSVPGSSLVSVGKIVGAVGLRGEVKVQSLTDVQQRFTPGTVLYLNSKPVRLREARKSKNIFVLLFEGVSDRTSAESLHDSFISVPESEVPVLPAGSFYHFEIIGMRTYSETGEYLGEVSEIIRTGRNDVYVVKPRQGRELLIPAVKDSVVKVLTSENMMVVRTPPEIL